MFYMTGRDSPFGILWHPMAGSGLGERGPAMESRMWFGCLFGRTGCGLSGGKSALWSLIFSGQSDKGVFESYPVALQVGVGYLLPVEDAAHLLLGQEREEFAAVADGRGVEYCRTVSSSSLIGFWSRMRP